MYLAWQSEPPARVCSARVSIPIEHRLRLHKKDVRVCQLSLLKNKMHPHNLFVQPFFMFEDSFSYCFCEFYAQCSDAVFASLLRRTHRLRCVYWSPNFGSAEMVSEQLQKKKNVLQKIFNPVMCGSPRISGWLHVGMAKRSHS